MKYFMIFILLGVHFLYGCEKLPIEKIEKAQSNLIIKNSQKQVKNKIDGEKKQLANNQKKHDVVEENQEALNAPKIEENIQESLIDQEEDLYYFVYRVKKGDIIGFIADKYNITEDTITSVNGITNTRRIQIGSYLKIPSISGILYTTRRDGETINSIIQKYKSDTVDIDRTCRVNNIMAQDVLKAGTSIFIPGAELDWVTRQEINGDLFSRPLRGRYYISSRFGYRSSPFTGKRTFHNGIDMAASRGTKIYAALPGVVTSSGWSNVYGNFAIVTHHSGYKTLYGHMDSLHSLTVKGRSVTTNSVLGYVGSTGLSTGDHLHFTIFKNGRAVNPANLWH